MRTCKECGAAAAYRDQCRRHYNASLREKMRQTRCDVPGCEAYQAARGLCRPHYAETLTGARDVKTRPLHFRKSASVSLRLENDTLEAVKRKADERGVDVAEYLRIIIKEAISE